MRLPGMNQPYCHGLASRLCLGSKMVQQADNERLKEALGDYKAGRLDKSRAVYLALLKQQP